MSYNTFQISSSQIHVSTIYQQLSTSDIFPSNGPRRFPLNHSVGNRMAAATMKRPKTSMARFNYTSTPVHSVYDIQPDEFITSPSIPKTHMPFTALRNQVRRGWEGTHYVREMSVGTGRDSMKFSQWNDISPWLLYLMIILVNYYTVTLIMSYLLIYTKHTIDTSTVGYILKAQF